MSLNNEELDVLEKLVFNTKIRKIVDRKIELIGKISELSWELKDLQKEEDRWAYDEKGPILREYVAKIVTDLQAGKRPVSVKEVENNCSFEEIDREEIKNFAHKQATKFLNDMNEYHPTNLMKLRDL